MPNAHEELRTCLSKEFSVDNLRVITNLALLILKNGPKNPAVFLVISSVSRWVADAWDDIPLSAPVTERVERQLRPHLEALINVADRDSSEVCDALNALATAFGEAVTRGLDSDLA
jgi:hypothetical protein